MSSAILKKPSVLGGVILSVVGGALGGSVGGYVGCKAVERIYPDSKEKEKPQASVGEILRSRFFATKPPSPATTQIPRITNFWQLYRPLPSSTTDENDEGIPHVMHT